MDLIWKSVDQQVKESISRLLFPHFFTWWWIKPDSVFLTASAACLRCIRDCFIVRQFAIICIISHFCWVRPGRCFWPCQNIPCLTIFLTDACSSIQGYFFYHSDLFLLQDLSIGDVRSGTKVNAGHWWLCISLKCHCVKCKNK